MFSVTAVVAWRVYRARIYLHNGSRDRRGAKTAVDWITSGQKSIRWNSFLSRERSFLYRPRYIFRSTAHTIISETGILPLSDAIILTRTRIPSAYAFFAVFARSYAYSGHNNIYIYIFVRVIYVLYRTT